MSLILDPWERETAAAIVGTATLARADPDQPVKRLAYSMIDPAHVRRVSPPVVSAAAKILLLLVSGIETQYRIDGDRVLERVGAAVAASAYAEAEES